MSKREEEQKRLCDAYKAVFSSPDGAVVLEDLFLRARVGTSSFDPDPYSSAERHITKAGETRLFTSLNGWIIISSASLSGSGGFSHPKRNNDDYPILP